MSQPSPLNATGDEQGNRSARCCALVASFVGDTGSLLLWVRPAIPSRMSFRVCASLQLSAIQRHLHSHGCPAPETSDPAGVRRPAPWRQDPHGQKTWLTSPRGSVASFDGVYNRWKTIKTVAICKMAVESLNNLPHTREYHLVVNILERTKRRILVSRVMLLVNRQATACCQPIRPSSMLKYAVVVLKSLRHLGLGRYSRCTMCSFTGGRSIVSDEDLL